MTAGVRHSIALFAVLAACLLVLPGSAAAQAGVDKALGQPTSASSVERPERRGTCTTSGLGCGPQNANDGNPRTRWGAEWAEGQWWQVDLGRPRNVDSVQLSWEYAFPRRYRISTSIDGVNFADALVVSAAFTLVQSDKYRAYVQGTAFSSRLARFVRVTSIERNASEWGISLWDVRVTGPSDSEPGPPPPAAPPAPFESAGSSPEGASPGGTSPGGTPPTGPAPAGDSPAAPTGPSSPGPAAPGSRPPRARPRPQLELVRPFPVVRISGRATRRGASIDLLSIRAPRNAHVRVLCRGSGCPKPVVRRRGSGRVPSIRGFFRAGTRIEVFVTRPGRLGKYTRFVVRSRMAPPLRRDGCAIHAATRPTACT